MLPSQRHVPLDALPRRGRDRRSGRVTRLAGSLTDITDRRSPMRSPGCRTGCSSSICSTAPSSARSAVPTTSSRCSSSVSIGSRCVNQSLGVLSADRLLVSVARRLQAGLRGTDVVSRDSGGIHAGAAWRRRVHGPARRHHRCERRHSGGRTSSRRAVARRSTSTDTRSSRRPRSASRVSTTGYERPEQLLQDAAIALHRAKAGRATPYELFDPAMRERAMTRLQHRDRSAERDRQRGDHGSLPAHHFARDAAHQGLRGARALAPSAYADPISPGGFHSHRRRHRHDSAARQARSRRIVPADGGVAAAVRPPARRASCASTCRPASSAITTSPRKSSRSSTRPGWSRRS